MATLVIENVDLDLLEKQRLILIDVVHNMKHNDFTTEEEDEALEGLLNMLDRWSDNCRWRV